MYDVLDNNKKYYSNNRLRSCACVSVLTLLLFVCTKAVSAADSGAVTQKVSESGQFLVSFCTEFDAITINQMHQWTVQLTTIDGNPVTDATLSVRGGMPAHDHGLPTAPRVTKQLKPGHYLVEGVKFQMPGHWTLIFDIESGQIQDLVSFDIML